MECLVFSSRGLLTPLYSSFQSPQQHDSVRYTAVRLTLFRPKNVINRYVMDCADSGNTQCGLVRSINSMAGHFYMEKQYDCTF